MISVIVPVYNAERYLEECLNSIQQQSYTDIEVILVNDGSTDHSKTICERYCEEDSRFYFLNQTNQGQSVARNVGVAASKGEFIAFVDSDDFLVENSKETTILFEGNSNEAVKIFPNHVLSVNPVTKLYRREIVESLPYPEGLIFEDIYCGIGMLKYIRKIIKIDYVGYYYRQHQASTMHQDFSTKKLDVFTVCDKLVELYSDREELLPYIGSFLVHKATMHYQNDIKRGNPYAKFYNQKLAEYVFFQFIIFFGS